MDNDDNAIHREGFVARLLAWKCAAEGAYEQAWRDCVDDWSESDGAKVEQTYLDQLALAQHQLSSWSEKLKSLCELWAPWGDYAENRALEQPELIELWEQYSQTQARAKGVFGNLLWSDAIDRHRLAADFEFTGEPRYAPFRRTYIAWSRYRARRLWDEWADLEASRLCLQRRVELWQIANCGHSISFDPSTKVGNEAVSRRAGSPVIAQDDVTKLDEDLRVMRVEEEERAEIVRREIPKVVLREPNPAMPAFTNWSAIEWQEWESREIDPHISMWRLLFTNDTPPF